jgi:hypothetical protein
MRKSAYSDIKNRNDSNVGMSHNPRKYFETTHERRSDDRLASDGALGSQGIRSLCGSLGRREIRQLILGMDQFLCMAFAQFAYRAYRETLGDIECFPRFTYRSAIIINC